MEVHVIRHTPVNFDKGRCYGQLDVPLAKSFKADVEIVKQQVDTNYDMIFCSPKLRCTALAEALELEQVQLDKRLLELDFGTWEGQLWDEIDQEALNAWMSDFVNLSPENGESLKQMYSRVSDFITTLRKTNYTKVLVIAHSGVIRCLWAYLLDIPLKNTFKLPVGFHEHFVFKLGADHSYDSIKKMN